MNQEQVKSTLRTTIATFGGAVAGWVAARGYFTADQVLSVITSETFIGLLASIAVGVWGLFTHTQKNAVAVVNEIAKDETSPVQGVIMAATTEGRAIAESIEGPTVTAGTPAATAIAKATP